MTYGTKQCKNGTITGELTFNTGKRIYLNKQEQAEFDLKLRLIEYTGREKEKAGL